MSTSYENVSKALQIREEVKEGQHQRYEASASRGHNLTEEDRRKGGQHSHSGQAGKAEQSSSSKSHNVTEENRKKGSQSSLNKGDKQEEE